MDCYAWKIPEGCYSSALLNDELACPSASWWWIALAVAAGAVLFGGKKKPAPRVRQARRKAK